MLIGGKISYGFECRYHVTAAGVMSVEPKFAMRHFLLLFMYGTLSRQGLEFPWWPKPVEDLGMSSQSNGFHLQELPSLVVFMEAADDLEQKEVPRSFRH